MGLLDLEIRFGTADEFVGPAALLPYWRVPEIQPVPDQTPHPETSHRPNPKPPRARVPAIRVPVRLLLPNYSFRPRP